MHQKSLLVFAIFLFSTTCVSAGEWGIHVHGFSYHPARHDKQGRKFNEVNPGLGFTYIFRPRPKSIWSVDAGCYRNSYYDGATYAGLTWKYRFTQKWSAGVAGTLFVSSSYHHGNPFVAPFPVLTFREGPVALNLIYFPRINNINPVTVFGVFATIYPF